MTRNTLPYIFALNLAWFSFQPYPLHAQTAAPATQSFDVVTIKPSKTFVGGMGLGKSSKDSISLINISPRALIANAYGLKPRLVLGGPDWMDSTEYDVEAKVLITDPSHPSQLTRDQTRVMMQSLLADRFKLAVHTEMRQLPVYELAVAKGGPKLHEAKSGDTYANGLKGPDGRSGAGMMMVDRKKFTGQAIQISGLVDTLSILLDRTVVDQTGLTGRYDIVLELPRPDRGPTLQTPPGETSGPAPISPDDSQPSLFTMVEEQLGLKLVSTKGPVKILVIDQIERPSEN